jgi:hypothetical protein
MLATRIKLLGLAASLAALLVLPRFAVAAEPADPLKLEWHRLATRRFLFSNNLPLNALVPGEVVAIESMHPLLAPGIDGPTPVEAKPELAGGHLILRAATVGQTPTLWVGGVNPYATYEIDVQAVDRVGTEPVEVAIDLATLNLSTRVQVVARHGATDGKGVVLRLVKNGTLVREDVFAPTAPEPPYLLQVQLSGRSAAAFATRAGQTVYLGHTQPKQNFIEFADFRDRALAAKSSFNVTCNLAGGTVTLGGAKSYLSMGVGQADIRMITHRDGSPYFSENKLWFTFSCRGLNITDSLQGVMSLDPSTFDPRLEGAIVYDHGDGKLRNDYSTHLVYDDDSHDWYAFACDFGGTAGKEERSGSGLVLGRTKREPLHGFNVIPARAMASLSDHVHEDPCVFYDSDAKKWRMLACTFAKGIKAVLYESDNWDGPYTLVAGPVERDSTGTLIQKIGDRRYVFAGCGSGDRQITVHSYPALTYLGVLKVDLPAHWPKGPARGWPNVFPLPQGYPYRYMALMMDRPNFPGVKGLNWSYGALYLFGAYTTDITDPVWEFLPHP